MSYDDLLEPVAARSPAPYGVLTVTGPDATDFLHRLCSQDVTGLPVGQARAAAFLDPKGKLVTTAWIGRTGPEAFWVEVQADRLDALADQLERYHFTERLEVGRPALQCGEIMGRGAAAAAGLDALACRSLADGAGVAFAGVRRGLAWARSYAPAAWYEAGWPGAGLPALEPERAERLRVVAGIPRVGVDTEPTTLALEADLDDHVSTTKGCYTGQEIVARIHTYGHVNRRLCLLALDTAEEPAVGTSLLETEDGDPVGRVMSSVAHGGGRLALGYLPKDFWEPGTALQLDVPGRPAVRVEAFGFGGD